MKVLVLILATLALSNAALLRNEIYDEKLPLYELETYHTVVSCDYQTLNFTYCIDVEFGFGTWHRGGQNATQTYWSYGLSFYGYLDYNFEIWFFDWTWINFTS